MMNYDTYTFNHKSHCNDCAPDVTLEFTTHQEEDLNEVLYMVSTFLISCGYSESQIRRAMNEFSEY